MLGYQIDWTAVGICLTAIIAVWQLRVQSKEKAADRELEAKREILFDGVRGMSQALQAFSSLSNLEIPVTTSAANYQIATSKMTVAASVASLNALKYGKLFGDTLGPLYMEGMKLRMELDEYSQPSRGQIMELAGFVLENIVELNKAMMRAIAAIRNDVGIAKETEQEFLTVTAPNEQLLNNAIGKMMGRTE